jgi:hypothetical protein
MKSQNAEKPHGGLADWRIDLMEHHHYADAVFTSRFTKTQKITDEMTMSDFELIRRRFDEQFASPHPLEIEAARIRRGVVI